MCARVAVEKEMQRKSFNSRKHEVMYMKHGFLFFRRYVFESCCVVPQPKQGQLLKQCQLYNFPNKSFRSDGEN